MGRTSSRAVAAILSAFFALAVGVPADAQKPTLRSTNSYTAKRLEEMRHPAKAAVTPSSGLRLPAHPGRFQFQSQTPRSTPATSGSSAATPSFPGLYAAPYVPATSPVDSAPVYASAVADFDGKSGPDVVTVQIDGALNLLANDGNGRFSLTYSNSSAVAMNPEIVYIESADLNKDGRPDIVALDATNSAFLVYMNNGDGSFADPASYPVLPGSGAVFLNGGSFAVGDVNGDGIPDVVTVANLQNGSYPSYTSVFSQQTFLGNGDGTFNVPSSSVDSTISGFLFIQFGRGIVIADLNGDHNQDLAIEYQDPQNAWVTVAGCLGTGDGIFASIQGGSAVRGFPNSGSTLQIGDLNRDGAQDAIYSFGDGSAYVALGKGDGTFQSAAAVLQSLPTAGQIQLGDFNGDGLEDLLVFSQGSVAVYAGQGNGTFNAAPNGQYGGNLGGDQQPVPMDFDNDGKLDFVEVDASYGTVSLYRGFGDGTFAAQHAVAPSNSSSALPSSSESPSYYVVVAAGDANGDGKADVVALDYTKPYYTAFGVYPDINLGLNDGKGGFTFSTILSGYDLAQVGGFNIVPQIVDFNHDGHFDLLLETDFGLAIAVSKPDGSLGAVTPIAMPVQVSGCSFGNFDIGNIDNDAAGNLDMLIAYNGEGPNCTGNDTPSGYFVLLGDGKGAFTSTFTEYGGYVYEAKLADFDGDGKLDIAIDDGYQTGILICLSCPTPITILRGNGNGTFDSVGAHLALGGWRISDIVIGDYDNDGKQDLTLLSRGQRDDSTGGLFPDTSGVLLLKGKGDFTFADPVLAAVDTFATQGHYVDLNGDGWMDLVFSLTDSFQAVPSYWGLVVMPNLGDGSFGEPFNYLEPQGDDKTLIADFNGDGSPDLLVSPTKVEGNPSVIFLNRGGNSLLLTANPAAITQGDTVVLRATLSTLPGTTPAAGTVSFYANGALVGTAPLTDGAIAELSTSALPIGTDAITATYPGDQTHNPSTAQAVTVSVQALAPTFSVSATPQTLNLQSGHSGTVDLNFVANATFNGQITVSCSGLPAGGSCDFSPANLTLSPGQNGSIQATITAPGGTQARNSPFSPGWFGAGSILALIFVAPKRVRKLARKYAVGMAATVCILLGLMLAGCGDNTVRQETHGSAVVTITATASSGGTSIQQTAVVSVTITN